MEGCTLVAFSPDVPARRDELVDIRQRAIFFGEADDMDGVLGAIQQCVATLPNIGAVVTDCSNSFFLSQLAIRMRGLEAQLGRRVPIILLEGGKVVATYPPLSLAETE